MSVISALRPAARPAALTLARSGSPADSGGKYYFNPARVATVLVARAFFLLPDNNGYKPVTACIIVVRLNYVAISLLGFARQMKMGCARMIAGTAERSFRRYPARALA